jgi:phospho-N-acetylmuramoyl-pentapeptide-transferase
LVWVALLGTLAFGALGFVDDYLKLRRPATAGLRVKPKLLFQIVLGFGLVLILVRCYGPAEFAGRLSVPFFKEVMPNVGWAYPVFGALVLVGASNAVNLTDGLDGLATGPVIVALVAYATIAYVLGNAKFAAYLNIVHVPGAGELTVFCGAALGASLGFLWYNAYPAELFMGNVGALALGAALGIVAVATKHELLLILVGGIFVIEAVSVMLQVVSFKSTGKRVFRMAPLHHHFEMKGWAEPKIIVRFWIVAVVLALLSLSTLKLR